MNKKPTLQDLATFGPSKVGGSRCHGYQRRWIAGERPERQKRLPFPPGKELNYYLRLKNHKALSIVKEQNYQFFHVAGLDVQVFDEEVWLCKGPESRRLMVAIDWFRSKYKRKKDEFTGKMRGDIREARREGASVERIARNYSTTRRTVREIVREQ